MDFLGKELRIPSLKDVGPGPQNGSARTSEDPLPEAEGINFEGAENNVTAPTFFKEELGSGHAADRIKDGMRSAFGFIKTLRAKPTNSFTLRQCSNAPRPNLVNDD